MNVRELLRYEIWSKRNTRKILIVLGAVIGLAVVGSVGWNEVDMHWLTSGERGAARAALAQIDSLDDASALSVRESGTRKAQAEESVDSAKAVAKTKRDRFVSLSLDIYLAGVELKREWHRGSSPIGEEQENRIRSDLNETILAQRLVLHNVLDRQRVWIGREFEFEKD